VARARGHPPPPGDGQMNGVTGGFFRGPPRPASGQRS